MANYPLGPGRRIAWDQDGSTFHMFNVASGIPAGVGSGGCPARANINDVVNGARQNAIGTFAGYTWPSSTDFFTTWQMAVMFPILRDIDGWFVNARSFSGFAAFTSPDTTNIVDGTWTSLAGGSNTVPIPAYRTSPTIAARSNVRAIRFTVGYNTNGVANGQLLLWGNISPGEAPDRLAFIDAVTGLGFTDLTGEMDQNIDTGDTPRGSSRYVDIFVRNVSATMTAQSIQISTEPGPLDGRLSDHFQAWDFENPAAPGFSPNLNFGNLAPLSEVTIRCRQQLPDDGGHLYTGAVQHIFGEESPRWRLSVLGGWV